jgi:hypothetical protein
LGGSGAIGAEHVGEAIGLRLLDRSRAPHPLVAQRGKASNPP